MRPLVALLICATLRPAPFEASFNGVWVLNERLSRFASSAKPDRGPSLGNSSGARMEPTLTGVGLGVVK